MSAFRVYTIWLRSEKCKLAADARFRNRAAHFANRAVHPFATYIATDPTKTLRPTEPHNKKRTKTRDDTMS